VAVPLLTAVPVAAASPIAAAQEAALSVAAAPLLGHHTIFILKNFRWPFNFLGRFYI
jgi:hypothetical protein